MPGTDYDSAINVHICRSGVPGMSAAYEFEVGLNAKPEKRGDGREYVYSQYSIDLLEVFMCETLYSIFTR